MVRVFFYGLFMDPELLTEQGLNPGNTSIASLPGYQLKIGERASLLESEGACCHGTVIELDNAELQALYRGDGVEDYEPVNVDAVDSNNRSLEAVSYILPIDKLSGSNSEYARKLANTAVKLGLPPKYISEIEEWI